MPSKPPGTPDLDLTDPSTWGIINDAVFMTGQLQPAGSGNNAFNAFVQLQRKGSEQGYNTDANAQYDEKNSHNHNHSILLADVPIVFGDGTNGTIDGLAYREFLLDLNEPNGGTKPYISLDKLQIWQEEAGNLTNFTPGSGFAGAHTNYLAYDLDAGANRWIGLDAGMSHGSGQSDYRILIPDSFFINDAAHRYVTLYSQFGTQPGWDSDGGFEEWGLHGASGGAQSALAVNKTASVPGGTADQAGEVISYTINVANVGNQTLTGVTVSDPFVSNLAPVLIAGFNSGDIDHDNALDAGETWHYTASYTVTQVDIDTLGNTGDGSIVNTVTADTTQTNPVSATSTVVVEQASSLAITKSADVTSVDSAGDVINYTVNVTNTGNTTLSGLEVHDPQFTVVTPIFGDPVLGPDPILVPVLAGDYNAGDTNENGIEDPGETFQYAASGDEDQDGIEDPDETWQFANVGDTNQNGIQDPGETFQFYNAGDTNHDGEENPGETFQFDVNDQMAGVDANNDSFNDGDVNHNDHLDVGETWQFTGSYTVTQADIDNGGVVDPGLTHDNTATATTAQTSGSASASVDIDQNPHVTLNKSATVPGGTADSAGEVIAYAISITNDGNMTLTSPVVSDPSVSDLAAVMSGGFNAGDADMDGKIDLGETWQYTASHTVTQAEMDAGGTISNTASVTTGQGASDSDSASITIVQNPHVVLDKTATVPGGTADTAGEVISYTIAVNNNGNVSLTNPVVSDPSVSDLAAVMSGSFNTGDTNTDGKLSVGETWQYTASHTVTQADIDTNGGGDGTIDNTASVTTTQGASANDSASVEVEQPAVAMLVLTKTSSLLIDGDESGGPSVADPIQYFFSVLNSGTEALHGTQLDDSLFGMIAFAPDTADGNGLLDPGETWLMSRTYITTADDIAAGSVDNDATLTGLSPTNVLVTSNTAHWHLEF